MVYEETIHGKYVTLKSVTIDDAEFTLALRQNPALTKFLPKLDQTKRLDCFSKKKRWGLFLCCAKYEEPANRNCQYI